MSKNYLELKKRIVLVVSLMFSMLSIGMLNAQGTIQIGSGTATTSTVPISSCWGYSYTQQIYLGSEYAAGNGVAGNITKIRFYFSSGTIATNWTDGWVVYLGHTTKTTFASTTDWVPSSGLTQVFSGNITPTAGSWVEITLSTPFNYNGVDNIVVAVDENTTGYTCSANWLGFTATPTNRAIYYRSDTNNPDPASPPTASGRVSSISQIQFEGILATCIAPTALTTSNIGADTANISWSPGSTAPLSWVIEYGPTGFAHGSGSVLSVNSMDTTLYGLSALTGYDYYVRGYCGGVDSSAWVKKSFTTLPSCPAPSGLTNSNLTLTSIDLSWTTGGSTQWIVEYGPTGFTHGTGTIVNVSTTSTTSLSGLTANANYTWYVRDYCTPGDSSTWVSGTFRTGYCAPNAAGGSYYINDFVTTGGTTNISNLGSGYSTGGYGNFYDSTAFMLSVPASLSFNFSATANNTGTNYGFSIWVDWNENLLFETTERVFNTTSYTYPPITGTVNIPLATAPGDYAMRILQHYLSSNPSDPCVVSTSVEIEDYKLTVLPAPSCLAPTSVTTEALSSDSALVYLTPFATAGSVVLEYGLAGFTQGSGTVVTSTNDSIYLTGLSSSSTYSVYVYSDCSSTTNDSSSISGPFSFTTDCAPVSTFPYFENFETGANGWYSGGANSSWQLATPANSVINSAFSGVNSWVTNATGSYNTNENSWVQNCFDFSALTNPEISLGVWWNCEFSWDGAKLQSSIDGGTSWQEVGALGDPNNWYTDNSISGLAFAGAQIGWSGRNSTSNGSGAWIEARHQLTGLGGQSNVLLRIAFGADGSVEDNGFAFDDVSVYDVTCFDPTNFAVSNVTDVSADFTWFDTLATSWGIEYGPVGFTPGSGTLSVVANDTTQLTGLSSNTMYEAYVRAICAAGDSSLWIGPLSFTTLKSTDVGVSAIIEPLGGCGMASTPFTITVENFGEQDQYFVPVVVQVSGDFSAYLSYVVDSLAAGTSVDIALNSINTLSGGAANIVAFTAVPTDEDTSNDSTVASISFGMVPAAPVTSPVTACLGDSVSLTAASVGTLTWFDSDTSSTPIFEGTSYDMIAQNSGVYYIEDQEEIVNATFTIDMYDSWGDGWNGGSLAVSINGSPVLGSPFTLATGSSGQSTFTASNGDVLVLNYTQGSYASEPAYRVLDSNGNLVFADGGGFTSGTNYAPTAGEVYNQTLSLLGCPSERSMIELFVNPSYNDTVNVTACDSMMIAGMNQTMSGFYTDSLTSASGCDSLIVYDLTINNSTSGTMADVFCTGSTYTLPDGSTTSAAGTYDVMISNAAGCDSLLSVTLTELMPASSSMNATICSNGTYTLPDGMVVSDAGTYTSTLSAAAANGCDSVVTTMVSVVNTFNVSQNVQICANDSVVVGSSTYSVTGTYTDNLMSAAGCDSIVTTNLVVFPSSNVTIGGVSTVCENAGTIDLSLDPVGGTLSGNGVTGTSFDPAVAGVGSHVLTYTYSDDNGCNASASLEVEVIVCTGIKDISGIETIAIFPNPYSEVINLQFEDNNAGDLNIKLFDITGRLVVSQTIQTTMGSNVIELRVPEFAATGVSIIQIERDGNTYQQTLIKK